MKLRYRRLLALVMCLVMCVSLFPASAFATEPVIEEPVITETAEEPAFEEPAAEPAVEEPAAEPLVEDPAEEPVVEEPAAEPVVEEPVEEPVAEEPVEEPVAEEPAAEPVAEEPAAEPVVEEPATEPVAEEPAAEPVVEEPAAEPVAEEPVEEPALVEETEEALEPIEAALAVDDRVESLKIEGYITRYVKDRHYLNGYREYNPDGTYEWYPGEFYQLDCWPRGEETLTVTLVLNGQTYTGTADDIREVLENCGIAELGESLDVFTDERPGNLYEAGETHTATIVVGGHFASYTVYVTDNPVKSVEVEPITRYMYDRCINYNGWDVIDCWPHDAGVTVKFHDLRSSVSGRLSDVEETLRGQDLGLGWDSDESPDNPWTPGEHTATFSVNGVDCEYAVTVLADPIEAFNVSGGVTRYDYDRFTRNNYWSDAEERWIDSENWDCLDAWPRGDESLTVTAVVGGQTYTGTADEVQDALNRAGYDLGPGWFSAESPAEPWGAGDHTAYLTLGNRHAAYTVTVLPDPVESLTVNGSVTRYVDDRHEMHNWWSDEQNDWVYEDWLRLDAWPRSDESVTVTAVVNGQTYTGTADEVQEALQAAGFDDNIGWHSDETPANLWGVGEHTAVFDLGSHHADYTVHVLPSPLKSMTVDDVTHYDTDLTGWLGYPDENGEWVNAPERWRIDGSPETIHVTVEVDGEEHTFSGDPDEVRDRLWDDYGINVENWFWNTEQVYGAAEIPETIPASFRFGSLVANYTLHVISNPISSVTVSPITRYINDRDEMWGWNDADNNWHDEDWDRVACWPHDATVTVTFKDGRAPLSGKLYEIEDALRAEFNIWHETDETPENPWTEGDHTATFYVAGFGADYTVTVLPNLLKSMTVDDVTRYDTDLTGWLGYQDENGEWVDAAERWRIDGYPETITVTVTVDGEDHTVSGNPEEVRDRLWEDYGFYEEHMFWNSDQVYGDPNIPETIGASFEFGTLKAPYTLHVLTNPIDTLTVSDITRYIIGRDQMWGWNDSEGEWHDGEWYRVACWPHDATVTVTFKDGRAPLSGKLYEIEDALRAEFDIWHETDETPENPWTEGDHTATFYVAGFGADYTVTVLPSPITSVEVDDLDKYDSELSGWTGYQDANGEWIEVDHEWRIECFPGNITVTVTVGGETHTHSGDPNEVRDTLNNRYGLNLGEDWSWDSDQVYGEEIPETIHAQFNFFGTRADYTVRVTANPIESVTVSPISRYVISRDMLWGWNDSEGEWHDQRWFRVAAWPHDATVTVTFKDGRAPLSGKLYEIEDTLRKDFNIWWDSDETPENPWGPNETHTATFYVADIPADYEVTVLPDPFRSLTVDDQQRYDNELDDWRAYQDENGQIQNPEENWRISCFPQNVTLTVEVDGETITLTGDPGEVRDTLNGDYNFNLSDEGWYWDSDQKFGEPIPETIHATFEWGTKTAEYTVHVVPNPIDTVTVSDIYRYEYETRTENGYRDGDEWIDEPYPCIACYPWDADVTVTFKDGSKPLSGKLHEIQDTLFERGFNIGHEQDETPLHPWVAGGAYTSILWIGGVPGEFQVHVLADPVESLTVTGGVTRYEIERYWSDDWFDEDSGEWTGIGWHQLDAWPRDDESLTITAVVGGKTYTGTADKVDSDLRADGYEGLNIGWHSDERPDALWEAGVYTVWFDLGGKSEAYSLEVLPSPLKTLTVEDFTRLDTDLDEWKDYYDEASDRWIDPGYEWRIACWPREITVTLEINGESDTLTGSPDEVREALDGKYGIHMDNYWSWNSDQPFGEPVPAVIHAEMMFCSLMANYTVTVAKDPIALVEAADITRTTADLSPWTNYVDEEGEWHEDLTEPWRIDCMPEEITVTLKEGYAFTDGSVTKTFTGDDEDSSMWYAYQAIYEATGVECSLLWNSEETPDKRWRAGEDHAAWLNVNGTDTAYFTVHVVEAEGRISGTAYGSGSATVALFPGSMDTAELMAALVAGDYADALREPLADVNGAFSLEDLASGTCYLTVAEDGYAPFFTECIVDGETDVGEIVLVLWGDVNSDGKRNADDALQILLFLQNKGLLVDNAYLQAAACVSNRGALTPTAADATLLQKCAIGLASID